MKLTILTALLAGLGFASPSFADPDEETDRSLAVRCDYSDYKEFQTEAVSIERDSAAHRGSGDEDTGKFKRGKPGQSVVYRVMPGEFAECVFPSGNKVRVKVGVGTARPYGMCGADPEVFGSIWVNERKLSSRFWFAGRCREYGDEPDVSFKFSAVGATPSRNVSFQKCHRLSPSEAAMPAASPQAQPQGALSVCVDFPDVSRFPRDEGEYPRPGQKATSVGDVEVLTDLHAVCKPVLGTLTAAFWWLFDDSEQGGSPLRRPSWGEPSVEPPEELAGGSESVFDFDNDGKPDRVLLRQFESTYMHGSVLLVERGAAESRLHLPQAPIGTNTWLVPCQMSAANGTARECPPFSQKRDDAGFRVKSQQSRDSVYFRARYATVLPFFFKGETFLSVGSVSTDTENFAAVLKPTPDGGAIQPVCLFRLVPENY